MSFNTSMSVVNNIDLKGNHNYVIPFRYIVFVANNIDLKGNHNK